MSRVAGMLPVLDRRSTWVLVLLFAGLALAALVRTQIVGVGWRAPARFESAPRDLVFPAGPAAEGQDAQR